MRAIAAAVVAAVSLFPAGEARACACCADPGDRVIAPAELTDFERAELARLQPAGPATVHMTPCGEECVRGIADLSENYAVGFVVDGRTLRLDLRSERAEGALVLTMPPSYERFSVDPAPEPGSRTTELYTEWRLSSTVAASGAFAAADGATAELVLHGRGNHCAGAETFGYWTLTVKGADADFRLFGKLAGR